jgi:hypothetical protein
MNKQPEKKETRTGSSTVTVTPAEPAPAQKVQVTTPPVRVVGVNAQTGEAVLEEEAEE